MTTPALDAHGTLTVAGPVAPPAHEGNTTRPEVLAALLDRQRAAFLRKGPPSLVERRATLKKLRAAVLARRSDLEAALDADFGHRSHHETAIMEVLALMWGIDYLHKNLRRFMRPERRRVSLPMRFARAHVEYQPRGVVAHSRERLSGVVALSHEPERYFSSRNLSFGIVTFFGFLASALA